MGNWYQENTSYTTDCAAATQKRAYGSVSPSLSNGRGKFVALVWLYGKNAPRGSHPRRSREIWKRAGTLHYFRYETYPRFEPRRRNEHKVNKIFDLVSFDLGLSWSISYRETFIAQYIVQCKLRGNKKENTRLFMLSCQLELYL